MTTHLASIDLEDFYSDVEGMPGNFGSAFARQCSVIIASLAETNTKCTFFVLGKTAERYPELITGLHRNGHEIASHGYGHARVDELSPKQFSEDIERSTRILEELTGTRPLGYRAPYFSVRRETFWLYDILADHGFRYSSSVFPFWGKRYGIGDFSTEPS